MRLRELHTPQIDPRKNPNRWMIANHPGSCSQCRKGIQSGQKILYRPAWRDAMCQSCGNQYEQTDPEAVQNYGNPIDREESLDRMQVPASDSFASPQDREAALDRHPTTQTPQAVGRFGRRGG